MEVSFRLAEEKDKPLIKELAREAGSEEKEIDYFLQQDRILVAADAEGQQFLGFVTYYLNQNQLKISELGVKEDYRQQGVGTRLLEEIKSIAVEKGEESVTVETSNDNIPALSLYQQFGFRIKQVKLGKLVEHHGQEETGWQGIPIRDLLRLKLEL